MYSPFTRSVRALVRSSINQPALPRILLFIALILLGFGLSRAARAVSPAPDGGYGGGNTAEGTDALFSLTGVTDNTAIGLAALFSNTIGVGNTATGYGALQNNTGSNNTVHGVNTLFPNTTGSSNVALGANAGSNLTTGSNNINIWRQR